MRSINAKSKSRLSLYIILLLAVILLMVMIRTCSQHHYSGRERHQSQGDTLDVGIEYSPMALYRYDDTLGGFSYDLMRYLASNYDLRVKFHPVVTISEATEGLDNGDFDIVIASIPMTTKYQEMYSFTEPIYLDRQIIIQRPDTTGELALKSQLDLGGKTVRVLANSPVIERIRNLSSEIGDTIYIIEDEQYGSEQLFIMAAIGEIPLAVVNERIAKIMSSEYPDIDISTAVSFTQFQPWILRKGDDELLTKLDSLIEMTKGSEFYSALEKKYMLK